MWLWIWIIIAFFVGATLGAVGMGILAGGKRRQDFISSSRLRSDRYSGGVQFSSRKNVHDRHLMDHGGFTSGNYYGKD